MRKNFSVRTQKREEEMKRKKEKYKGRMSGKDKWKRRKEETGERKIGK